MAKYQPNANLLASATGLKQKNYYRFHLSIQKYSINNIDEF